MSIERSHDTFYYIDSDGNRKSAIVVLPKKMLYALLDNDSSTGERSSEVDGGDYIWRVEGNLNGATAKLQFLSLDGNDWFDFTGSDGSSASLTENGSIKVTISQGSILRVELTNGSPSAVYSVLGGI